MGERNRNGDIRLSLADLTDRAGVSVRTVRYYIAEGLLPPPNGSGPASYYSPSHLDRLKLIGRLKDAYLPLKEIRRRLDGVEDRELPALLALSDPELFDPATWERRGGSSPRTVTSYVERVARESRAPRASMGGPQASFHARLAPDVRLDADYFDDADATTDTEFESEAGDIPFEALDAFAGSGAAFSKAEPETAPMMRVEGVLPSMLSETRLRRLERVSAERPEIEQAAGPAWRRVALGEEIELMVSDRAWRRNREKLEWLANWARKVLR
jgi:DNA-binding transcriptional MerR regulator